MNLNFFDFKWDSDTPKLTVHWVPMTVFETAGDGELRFLVKYS